MRGLGRFAPSPVGGRIRRARERPQLKAVPVSRRYQFTLETSSFIHKAFESGLGAFLREEDLAGSQFQKIADSDGQV